MNEMSEKKKKEKRLRRNRHRILYSDDTRNLPTWNVRISLSFSF